MFETLLQGMSNDGFEVIIATQTSFNGVNNTGGEANPIKCILLCLIKTSDSCYHQSEKSNYFERLCFDGHFKRSRCGRLWKYHFKASCRIKRFQKKDWNIYTFQQYI